MTSHMNPKISKRAAWRAAIALAALGLAAGCNSPDDSSQILLGNKTVKSAAVKGTLIAELRASSTIELPDVELTLTELNDPSITVTGQSDIQGRFALWAPQPGDYQLCWYKPGFISQCYAQPITVAVGQGASLGYLTVQADYELSGLRGKVTLADGAPCSFLSPYFGITQMAQVRVDVAGLTYDVRGNINGEYVVGGVPPGNDVDIHASCGRVTSTINVPASQLDTSGANAYDVALPNHAPTAKPYATLGGKGVSSAALGEILEVVANAEDADGDGLYYDWRVPSASSGTITSFSSPTALWMLWGTPGYKSVYVLVRDDNDLYREARARVVVGAGGVIFGGTVTDESNAPVADATVTVTPFQENSPREPLSAQTDSRGGFTIPMDEAERYHISIQKPGYVFFSEGVDRWVADRTWRLRSAFVARGFDPNETIDVTEERRSEGDEGRELPGVRVIIPPGSLVDKADGETPPPGPVDVYLATIDPSEMAMPGDQMASRNLEGREGYLISLGAAMVEVRDATRDYTINGEAELFIPITRTLVEARELPESVAMWTLDEATGVWQQDIDRAERHGESYATIIRHLSVFNLDIEKTDPACMRINVDTATMSLPLDVEIRVQDISQNIDQTVTKTLNDPLNVLYRLPPHALITVKPLDSQGNAIVAAQPPTTSSNATATNGQGATVQFPASPYAECNSEVTISLVPQWAGYPASPFLTFEGTPPSSNGYYQAIDPNNDKDTLGKWWDENGFDATDGSASGAVKAQYFNAGDLGFGRNMNCLQNGQDVACWVSNYPDANSAYNHDIAYSFATVAMEYSPGPNGGVRFVKFYVFDGEDPGSARLDAANLDGFGAKHVPYLCMNCHGGSQSGGIGTFNASNMNLNASFLPFDLDTFEFPAASNPNSTAVQQAFFDLNALVQATNPNQGISDIISAWYDKSPNPSGPPYDGTKAINDWTSGPQNGLYDDVVKGACRGCHQAQEDVVDFSTYNQGSFDDFKAKRNIIDIMVCGSGKSMPHAFVTYRNFWQSSSPSQPNALASYSDGSGWTAIGTCQ